MNDAAYLLDAFSFTVFAVILRKTPLFFRNSVTDTDFPAWAGETAPVALTAVLVFAIATVIELAKRAVQVRAAAAE